MLNLDGNITLGDILNVLIFAISAIWIIRTYWLKENCSFEKEQADEAVKVTREALNRVIRLRHCLIHLEVLLKEKDQDTEGVKKMIENIDSVETGFMVFYPIEAANRFLPVRENVITAMTKAVNVAIDYIKFQPSAIGRRIKKAQSENVVMALRLIDKELAGVNEQYEILRDAYIFHERVRDLYVKYLNSYRHIVIPDFIWHFCVSKNLFVGFFTFQNSKKFKKSLEELKSSQSSWSK